MSEEIPDTDEAAHDGALIVPEVREGEVDLGSRDGIIKGDIHPGGVVHTTGHLRVEGAVLGDDRGPCVIEAGETLVLDRGAQRAQLRARHVVSGGDLAGSDISSDLGVVVRGNLVGSTVSLGHRTGEIQALRRHRHALSVVQRDLETVDVKIGSGARRFVRDYPQVNLALGRILNPGDRELKVNLGPFYEAIKRPPSDDLKAALQDFYLKVMVGMITRSNRHYVIQNPSRQRIFLKLVEELREHLVVVLQGDVVRRRVNALAQERDEMLARLRQPVPLSVRVYGAVTGDVRVRAMALSNIRETPRGSVDVDEAWAELKVSAQEGGLESWSLAGRRSVARIDSDALVNGIFAMEEDRLVWKAAAR